MDQNLVGRREGKRVFRWQDNIKMDLEGVTGLIRLGIGLSGGLSWTRWKDQNPSTRRSGPPVATFSLLRNVSPQNKITPFKPFTQGLLQQNPHRSRSPTHLWSQVVWRVVFCISQVDNTNHCVLFNVQLQVFALHNPPRHPTQHSR